MPPRKPPPDPPTDEEWDRRTLEGVDPEAARDRRNLRRLADKADVLVAMAESRERWSVFRSIAMKFLIATGALVAALSAFREQLLSLFSFLRGGQ